MIGEQSRAEIKFFFTFDSFNVGKMESDVHRCHVSQRA